MCGAHQCAGVRPHGFVCQATLQQYALPHLCLPRLAPSCSGSAKGYICEHDALCISLAR